MFASNVAIRLMMVLVGVIALAGSALGEPVALVTDLSGSGSHDGSDLEILVELEAGNKVTLADGSVLSVVFYANGDEYNFSGPAAFEVGQSGPGDLSGAAPVSRQSAPKGFGAVSTIGLAQAAMVMRGNSNEARLTLVFPAETTLLSAPDEFRWHALDSGVGYSFELTDFEGRSMIETTVNGTSLEVPEQLKLVPGGYYTWSIETRLPDGQKYSNWANFSVADSELLASVAENRPDDEDNVSSMVQFALWLEENELIDESQKYWFKINELRPGVKSVQARLGLTGGGKR